ncbi:MULTISPECIES: DUF817 domain-containing protein [unclassified Methylobacterium]|uniref:DUF817 domain-containing protein n=1 Tax=unclassified Methylobacterium TaxID=2615210 RepID=UPI0006F72148|nr:MULTISPECIES: DUF817 domain-containing protein [unclassified Methylobacterium]KQO60960.1 hypothetical protein ASF24_03155 [Methylobacterium sp. Leaf86]KQO87950.1 hypothetical protein ASF32_06155 [Methylobacterium sp. Leaf91]
MTDIPTQSAVRTWPPIARFAGIEARLGAWALGRGPFAAGLYEFLRFGIKQGWACLFGGLLCALLIASYLLYPPHAAISRYDFLTLSAVAIQIALLALRMETWEEAKVIALFHVVGTVMEIFKTAVGSWIYPEASLLRIAGVPLFTGFMYASIGSYIARVWRLFDFRFTHHPGTGVTLLLAAAIYVNFFTHHYATDIRLGLFAATAVLFGRTWVHFKVWRVHRRMPLLLGFLLVALFIWFAENIGTGTRVWLYPNQTSTWAMVSWQKLGAWYLLMIISYVLVTLVNKPEIYRHGGIERRNSR